MHSLRMKKLIQDCKNLNRNAQREMVDHLSPFLYSICCRYALSHEDAKDLLQESLILIFNNIEKFEAQEVAPFKSWCRKIAINNALSKKRKKAILTEMINETEVNNASRPIVYSQLNVEDILSLLKSLPENQRMVFNLFIIDNYSHREIGEILNIRESSSRTFLTRARHSLQALILAEEQTAK